LEQHGAGDAALASITVAEVLHGFHRAVTPGQRAQREAFAQYLLAIFAVLPFDLEEARVHARIGAEMASKGVTVGAHDLIIAATAIAHDLQVATRDLRSFPRIPGLALLQW